MFTRTRINKTRMAYSHFVEKNKFDKYSGYFLFSKDDKETTKLVQDAMQDAARKKFIDTSVVRSWALLDGDEKKWKGFGGNWYVVATSKNKPFVKNDPQDGDLVDLVVEFRAYKCPRNHNNRVYAELVGVKCVKKGGLHEFK